MSRDSFEHSTTVDATAMQVLYAFLDTSAIRAWWKARSVVVQPRPGGLFVVEWEAEAPGKDAELGPLGGVLAGTIDRSMAGHCLHFGALHWLSPRGEVYGPTRLEIDVFSKGDPRRKPTLLRVRGNGFQEGARWQRYLQVANAAWEKTLQELRAFCEAMPEADVEGAVAALGTSYLAEAVLQRRRIS